MKDQFRINRLRRENHDERRIYILESVLIVVAAFAGLVVFAILASMFGGVK